MWWCAFFMLLFQYLTSLSEFGNHPDRVASTAEAQDPEKISSYKSMALKLLEAINKYDGDLRIVPAPLIVALAF